MSDGVFGAGQAEQFQQANISRERFLVVNTDPSGVIPTIQTGNQVTATAASGCASLDPNDLTQGVLAQLGPHFIMSGETSDGVHPYGFSMMLTDRGLLGTPAVPLAGGFTVTPWVLIGNLMIPNLPASFRQQYGSIAPATLVNVRELYHCFSINVSAIRFQIGNIATHGDIGIVFWEL